VHKDAWVLQVVLQGTGATRTSLPVTSSQRSTCMLTSEADRGKLPLLLRLLLPWPPNISVTAGFWPRLPARSHEGPWIHQGRQWGAEMQPATAEPLGTLGSFLPSCVERLPWRSLLSADPALGGKSSINPNMLGRQESVSQRLRARSAASLQQPPQQPRGRKGEPLLPSPESIVS